MAFFSLKFWLQPAGFPETAAVNQVIIDDSAPFKPRIDNLWPDKRKSLFLHILTDTFRQWCCGGHLRGMMIMAYNRLSVDIGPDQRG
jgi:hypothetical protein